MNSRVPDRKPPASSPGEKRITRRTALVVAVPTTLSIVGVHSVAGEPFDGKGNDVCPCFLDIDDVTMTGDETIRVSGPCSVANPPEAITVRVHVRGEGGAQATGSETIVCEGSESDPDQFSLAASIRGVNRFESGDNITVHAKVHINPDGKPAVTGRWSWSGTLS